MTKIWLIGAGVVLGGLLIAAVAVALLEKEDFLPEGTPEAAVQNFLLSLEGEDYDASYDFLSAELKQDCKIDDLFGANRISSDRLLNVVITMDDTTFVADTAFVTFRLTQTRGRWPFDSPNSSYTQQFSLQQEEGDWKFTKYPWPLFQCGPIKPVQEFRAPAPVERSEPATVPKTTPTPEAAGK